jgi:hypothetical protein
MSDKNQHEHPGTMPDGLKHSNTTNDPLRPTNPFTHAFANPEDAHGSISTGLKRCSICRYAAERVPDFDEPNMARIERGNGDTMQTVKLPEDNQCKP